MSALNFSEIAKKQDEIVLSIIGQKNISGFEKAYAMSDAIGKLKLMLTDEYMAPIMALQGTRLGFKTDKDMVKQGGVYVKGPGYPIDIVRTVLIEAVFYGLQPCGNQFNIIGGNMYPTKEGLAIILNKFPGLKYSVVPKLTKVSNDKTSAIVDSTIKWNLNGEQQQETIEIPLKIDTYTSVDAIVGKSKRKSYAWLYERITGESCPEGEVEDIPFEEIKTPNSKTLPPLPDTEIQNAINEIVAGNTTLEAIKLKFTVSPEQEDKINKNTAGQC